MLKSNKGVTLVALIITIIVLLILAGVSISLVVGDNGVMNRAVTAAEDTNEATAKEQFEMAVTSVQSDFIAEKWINDTSAEYNQYCTADKLEDYTDDSSVTVDADDTAGEEWGATAYAALTGSNELPDSTTYYIGYKGVTYSATLTLTSAGTGATVTWNGEVTD